MPKVTHGTRLADCGHAYDGFLLGPAWPHCRLCMRAMRRAMHWQNEERRRLLAEAQANRTTYYIPPAVRRHVYERDDWTCQLCLEPVDDDLPANDIWSATLDHIVCRSWVAEPDHSESNLRLAHRWCNAVRGNEATYTADVLLPPDAAA